MYNSIPDMIQGGQFGMQSPMQQQAVYNPYGNYQQQPYSPYNNMVPINTTYQPQQQFVYQPVNNGYTYYQEPRYNYYDPYGSWNQQSQYNNYQNPYGNQYGYQNNYRGYQPFVTLSQRQQMLDEAIECMKDKYRMVAGYFGREIDEEALDIALNPNNEANIPSEEEIEIMREHKASSYISYLMMHPSQYETKYDRQARYCRMYSESLHKELDSHSLAQFLSEDLWKLQREDWLRENIDKYGDRNLSNMYDSKAYNELLNMHKDSNSYMSRILNNSTFDNNIDDMEVGLHVLYDKERRKHQILAGKVPTFISDEETQRRRNAWTNKILEQMADIGRRPPDV